MLSVLDAEPIAMGKVGPFKWHSALQAFFAVWHCPDGATLEALVSGSAHSGSRDYFDTISSGGEGIGFMGYLAQLDEAG